MRKITHTGILLPPSLVSQPVCYVRLHVLPLAFVCMRISVKADPALSAPSVSLCNFYPFSPSGGGTKTANALLSRKCYVFVFESVPLVFEVSVNKLSPTLSKLTLVI